jgi:hypothetical protein
MCIHMEDHLFSTMPWGCISEKVRYSYPYGEKADIKQINAQKWNKLSQFIDSIKIYYATTLFHAQCWEWSSWQNILWFCETYSPIKSNVKQCKIAYKIKICSIALWEYIKNKYSHNILMDM